VKHFPRKLTGVFSPGTLPVEIRRAILADVRSRDIRVALKITQLKRTDDEEEEL
jgi:hypothetical protein